MPNKFIVMTTISRPTHATLCFVAKKDWQIIIVGDKKTPHEEYEQLARENSNVQYMSPDYQDACYPELSAAIGWNKIMRRNLGFVEAYKRGADIVATVDDDNIPYEDWGKNLLVGKEVYLDCWEPAKNKVFDPLSITNINNVWHRGFPAELIPTRNDVVYKGKRKRTVLVQADLWDGVPDVDAMSRITYNPRYKLNVTEPYCSNCIAPFNSQNTFISRRVLPYYMVLPFVGRMDDIWGAYMIQNYAPGCVAFCPASVYQERYEPHARNIKDLKDEMIGYEHTLDFIFGKYKLPEEAQIAYDIYRETYEKIDINS